MQVLKFGGSSVASATRMSGVMDIVCSALERGRVVLVCSAISGCTDALLEIAATSDPVRRFELIEILRQRHSAIIRRLFTGAEREGMLAECESLFQELASAPSEECVSFGEIFSTRIIARKCLCDGMKSAWIDSRKLICVGSDGKVDCRKSYTAIRAEVESMPDADLFVAPGFIASDEHGKVTTLGRGGSDYSAALYAAALNAEALEIWTDVPGMMTANPKVVPAAVTIPRISYKAALELAANGAKVLYAPTIMPAMEGGIDIAIKNSFDPSNPGSVIGNYNSGNLRWIGVTSIADRQAEESTICLVGEGVSDRKSGIWKIDTALCKAGIKSLGEIWGEAGSFFFKVGMQVEKEAVAAIHKEFFETRGRKYTDEMIDTFREILSIESTSGTERQMAEWFAANFKAEKIEKFEVGDGTLNVLLSWGTPKVVFCSHMDTVPPYIPPVFDGETIHGRGSCDAKGQVYAMYRACTKLAEMGRTNFGLLILSGEETGSWGAKAFAKTDFRADYLVVGEPTDNCLVNASKGTKSFDLHFTGKAFHSGYPENGLSAVEMFTDFMQELRAADFPKDDILGETTWNVGLLRSDNPQNILSPELSCRIYFRTTFASDARVVEWMKAHDRQGLQITARGGDTPAEYMTIPGFRSKPVAFGSDAPHLSNFKYKMICGPGSINVAHRDDECISVSDLNEATQNYIDIYESCN